ncbi:type IV pilus assembly protein PilE [Paucimonas lemoignei]|uniref:Type IV pilus assembly protein PilE n=1 Tax=Paucimonas lemoignei TaxID=29443 RepID=A0A4R3HRH0_PAULE|nr:type IV pilus assembly protein PilE [Paucimonas lemoignei]
MIELVITVSIIAVLAALVYPSYQHAIRKAKRTEARAALLQLMQQQERFYSLHTTYVQFSADATDVEAKQFKWYSGDNPASSTYEIQGKACADSTLTDCVLITATAGGSRVGKGYDDPECQVMSLTSNGAKLPVGEKCW